MNGALRSVLASIARRDRCTNLDSDSAPFSHESADLVRLSLSDLRRTKGGASQKTVERDEDDDKNLRFTAAVHIRKDRTKYL